MYYLRPNHAKQVVADQVKAMTLMARPGECLYRRDREDWTAVGSFSDVAVETTTLHFYGWIAAAVWWTCDNLPH